MTTDTQPVQPIEDRPNGAWDFISASRLTLWAKCPLAFRIRYVDRVRSPTTASLFLGQRVHAGLEHWYRHRQLGVTLAADDVVKHIGGTWGEAVTEAEMTFQSTADEQKLQAQSAALVTAYLAQVPADEPKPLAVETRFEVPLVDPLTGEDLGMPLVGVVDLVLDGEDGPTIIDFKTAARGGDLLEIGHEVQLSCYAYGFRKCTGRTEGGLQIRRLTKTKTPKVDTFSYAARGDAHFRRLFALLRAYLDDLDRGRFVFRPGFGCGMCDYSDGECRSWCR